MYWITELDGKKCPAVGGYDSQKKAREAAFKAVKESPYPIFLAVVPEESEVWQIASDDHPDAGYADTVVSREGELDQVFHLEADGDERFYGMNTDPRDGHIQPFGDDTHGIVDEEQGGIIAYCHSDNTTLIIQALRKAY